MLESPTMTCSRRKRSASAWGSSRVLMMGRLRVVADDTPSQMCSARCDRQNTAPRAVCRTLPGAGVDLAADEERDEHLGVVGEVVAPARQVVLVAAVGVAGRVGVVLEQVDDAADALLAQSRFGPRDEVVEDALPRLVVGHQVGDGVALGCGVLGVTPHVEVQPGAVLEEDVGRATPAHDAPEQIAGDLVGLQTALAAQGAGDAVLVLESEDPPVHVSHGSAGCALWRLPSWDRA